MKESLNQVELIEREMKRQHERMMGLGLLDSLKSGANGTMGAPEGAATRHHQAPHYDKSQMGMAIKYIKKASTASTDAGTKNGASGMDRVRGKNNAGIKSEGALPQQDVNSKWEEAVDPKSGRVYFYNRGTGVSRWDLPEGASLLEKH